MPTSKDIFRANYQNYVILLFSKNKSNIGEKKMCSNVFVFTMNVPLENYTVILSSHHSSSHRFFQSIENSTGNKI